MTPEERKNPPGGVLFDEEDLLQFAEGDVASVFGPGGFTLFFFVILSHTSSTKLTLFVFFI